MFSPAVSLIASLGAVENKKDASPSTMLDAAGNGVFAQLMEGATAPLTPTPAIVENQEALALSLATAADGSAEQLLAMPFQSIPLVATAKKAPLQQQTTASLPSAAVPGMPSAEFISELVVTPTNQPASSASAQALTPGTTPAASAHAQQALLVSPPQELVDSASKTPAAAIVAAVKAVDVGAKLASAAKDNTANVDAADDDALAADALVVDALAAQTPAVPHMATAAPAESLAELFINARFAAPEKPAKTTPVKPTADQAEADVDADPQAKPVQSPAVSAAAKSSDAFFALMEHGGKMHNDSGVMAASIDGGLPEDASAKVNLASSTLNSLAHRVDGAANALRSTHSMMDSPFARLVSAQHSASEQVLVHVKQAAADGMSSIKIQLDPADLGKVEVQLDMDNDGKTGVIVTADNKDTLDMLQRDARALERALNDAGLKTDMGSLSFQMRGDQNKGQQQFADHFGGWNQLEGDDEAAAILPSIAQYRLSVETGLDIRV